MTLKTPLFEQHQALGSRMMAFGGWLMPIQYQGILAEHQAVRTQVGIFDVSHMGKLWLRGADVGSALAKLVPTDLAKLQDGDSQYTLLLNPEGGILDDIIVYRVAVDCWLAIVNAATRDKDRAWIERYLAEQSHPVTLEDRTPEQTLLAIQGSQSVGLIEALLGISLGDLQRFQHRSVLLPEWGSDPILIARTGYTGEDGVEILSSNSTGIQLWKACLDQGIPPCGLGCRDTLRLEAGMHLYGQDMDESTTPVEASLSWLLTQTQAYVGRECIQQQQQAGVERKLVALKMLGRSIARPGNSIFGSASAQDPPIGSITSGTQSPTLKVPIAMGYLPPAVAKLGSQVWVEIRGQRHVAEVVKRPFYRALG
ncbi:MAG: glycine cleavage system aminomethyltransferase GcvT [Synechococcaceae cyanobacterium SM2_3_2]|nr:glycine cleavage system aminomethyltransferase GcvT [Synechococcaceae cyanobacterium SM2_3_2]